MTKKLLGVSLVAVLAVLAAVPALAAVTVVAEGEVTAIDAVAGTFQIQSEAGDTFEVNPPAGFDLATLSVGAQVHVEGTLAGGVITATLVELITAGDEVVVTGEVTAVGDADFTLDVDGTIYTVVPPDGFDLASLEVGAAVTVTGTLLDGVITATSVELAADEDEGKGGFYCLNLDARHPALNGLATVYGEPYAELLGFFCEGRFGVGEIMLALQTAAVTDLELGEVLGMRSDLGGWGQVWHSLSMNGGERAKGNGK